MMRLLSLVPLNSGRQKSWHRFGTFFLLLSLCNLVSLTFASGIAYADGGSASAPQGTNSIGANVSHSDGTSSHYCYGSSSTGTDVQVNIQADSNGNVQVQTVSSNQKAAASGTPTTLDVPASSGESIDTTAYAGGDCSGDVKGTSALKA